MSKYTPGRRNRKTQANKQLILDKTMELFNNNGYEQTTMADISKATGLSNGSLYHLFRNKDLILIEIYKTVFKDEIGLNHDIESKLQDPVHYIKDFIIQYEARWATAGWYLAANLYRIPPQVGKAELNAEGVNDWTKTHRKELESFIKAAQDAGTLPAVQEASFLTNCIFTFGRGLLYEWSSRQGSFDFVANSRTYWDKIIPAILN